MKKVIITVLSIILTLFITMTAVAIEVTNCVVYAENVTAAAGGQVTVPVKISSNSGFTNFAVALDYDRTVLELISIIPAKRCGELTAASTQWNPDDDENAKDNADFKKGDTYGYVVCASDTAVIGDGELFTATFKVSSDFSGSASVTPIVSYMRNNSANFAIFQELSVTAQSGTVTESDVLFGDVDGNGKVTAGDASLILQYVAGKNLSEFNEAAADVNCDGKIAAGDASLVLQYVAGIINSLPV